MTPTYKATDQKWTIWDCPDEPFTHNKDFFRVAIELPVYNYESKTIDVLIRPSYTIAQDERSLFTCVYEMEYEISLQEEKLSVEKLSEIILTDCYPAFIKAFEEQKLEFPAVKDLPPPTMNEEIRKTVLEGSAKALRDSGYIK